MNKFRYLFLILLSLIYIQSAYAATVPVGFQKGTSYAFGDMALINSSIDYLVSVGGDNMLIVMYPFDINKIRAGGFDYYKQGITYANKKGINIIIILDIDSYVSDRELFKTDTVAQNKFLSDLEWVLKRYPTVSGLQLEEPQSYITNPTDGGLAWRTFTNSFFTKAKNIVVKYHNIDSISNFMWSFNTASSSPSGIAKVGIDMTYINNNKLFNAYFIQTSTESFSRFQNVTNNFKNQAPNLGVVHYIYLTDTGLLNACEDQYPEWDSPTCWNQAVFKQAEWAHNNNISIGIFTHNRLAQPKTRWPSETIPGNTAGAKIKYIWSNGVLPTPTITTTPKPTITTTPKPTIPVIVITPPIVSIQSGSMSVNTNPPMAQIVVNDEPVGFTNKSKITLPATPFYIKIFKDGFKPITDFGVIRPGKNIQKTYTMQPVNQTNWFKEWVDGILGWN